MSDANRNLRPDVPHDNHPTGESESETEVFAKQLRAALTASDLQAYAALLDEHVRWGGETDTPETCHGRTAVLDRMSSHLQAGMRTTVIDIVPGVNAVLLVLRVSWPVTNGFAREGTVYQALQLQHQQVVDIRGYANRDEAARHAGVDPAHGVADSANHYAGPASANLEARQLVPILNVSNLPQSFAWFAALGWSRSWDWRATPDGPPTFGALTSGTFEIFLCLDGQGGRGREPGIGGGGQGVWLSIWVDDVDAVHAICEREHMEVLQAPRNEAWGVREMHVRHPDGHVLRISAPAPHSH